MTKFTANAYNPRNREFIPMDDLLESQEFDRLTNATKVPLYQQKVENDRVYYDQSKWSSIICQGQEVNSVGPNYDLIQHQDAFVQVIDTLNKAGINMQGRVNDYGKVAWMDMVFENLKIEDPTNEKGIELGYSVRSGYAYHGLNLIPFAVRGICTNGCIFNQTPKLQGLMDPISVSHVGDAGRRLVIKMQDLLQDTIKVKGVFLEIFNRANGEFFRFSSEKELELTIASYGISEKQVKQALNRGTINLENCSRYELYNCLTEYATWGQLSPGLYESIQGAAERCLNEQYESTIGRITEAAITLEAK